MFTLYIWNIILMENLDGEMFVHDVYIIHVEHYTDGKSRW